MGWSHSVKAGKVLEALSPSPPMISNGIVNEKGEEIGFFEYESKEHPSGAISGEVFKYASAAKSAVWSEGKFLISGAGKIVRFPLISKALKAKAEAAA